MRWPARIQAPLTGASFLPCLPASSRETGVYINSCKSASALAASSALNLLEPVRLPPGRLRLATSPSCTGSVGTANTIGMLVVAALAARVATLPAETLRPLEGGPDQPPAPA